MNDREKAELATHYTYIVFWDEAASSYGATCQELPGISGFADSPVQALIGAIRVAREELGGPLVSDTPVRGSFVRDQSEWFAVARSVLREAQDVPTRLQMREWSLMLALLSHLCRQFLARGGTSDTLSVELAISKVGVARLLDGQWPLG